MLRPEMQPGWHQATLEVEGVTAPVYAHGPHANASQARLALGDLELETTDHHLVTDVEGRLWIVPT